MTTHSIHLLIAEIARTMVCSNLFTMTGLPKSSRLAVAADGPAIDLLNIVQTS
jgi:hypothetical protein